MGLIARWRVDLASDRGKDCLKKQSFRVNGATVNGSGEFWSGFLVSYLPVADESIIHVLVIKSCDPIHISLRFVSFSLRQQRV